MDSNNNVGSFGYSHILYCCVLPIFVRLLEQAVCEEDMEIIVPQREAARRQKPQRIQLESSGRYAGTAQMVAEKSA